MKIRVHRSIYSFIIFCVALTGCTSDPLREQVTPGMQSGTEILGEVVIVVDLKDVLHHSDFSGFRQDLIATGVSEQEITDGSEVIVWTYCYAHNSSVGCKHGGRYVAHVVPGLKGKVDRGSIVTVRLTIKPGRWPIGLITEVLGKSADPALACKYRKLNYKGLASFSPYGPPTGGWLECNGIHLEGWARKCVPGAPPPGPLSDQNDCISELQKAAK